MQFTIFNVIHIIHWPPSSPSRILSTKIEGGNIAIVADQRGSITLSISEPSKDDVVYHFQAIELKRPGLLLISATHNGSEASITINSTDLKLDADASGMVQMIEVNPIPNESRPSWNDPEAASKCNSRVQSRASNFRPKTNVKDGRRLKSIAEQAAELRRAARILNDLGISIKLGKQDLLGHLAAELRALLHWRSGSRSLNPLLLRLAARGGLALPVYFVDDSGLPPIVSNLQVYFTTGMVSITRLTEKHKIADLEDWLSKVIFRTPMSTETESTEQPEFEEKSIADLITMVSDKLGAAHYDEDTEIVLDRIIDTSGPTTNMLIELLLSAADVVAPLCEYVAAELTQQKK